ncbi:MAG: hypothetical protein VX642_06940, partial [Bdellovibrionota bacterium]|nr:hypothetical protein [Bdellovibrionota bacterium]
FIKYQSFFIEELEENLSEKNLETTETLDTKQNYSLSLAFLIKPVASVLIMSIYHYASSRVLASTASGLSPPL